MSDEQEVDVTDDEAVEETADAPEEPEEDTAEEAESGLQDGDFIELAYTARTVESDQLVDTTDVDVAEEEGIDTDEHDIGPRTIILGAGHVFQAVEDEIIGSEVGQSGTVVVPAAEAFGEYDDTEVRTVSADKIPDDSRHPGAQVQIDGQQGYLETIIGGRARVDFNHPLAGEDIEYDYEVLDVIEDREEKASGLLNLMFDVDLDVWFETEEVENEIEDDDGETTTEIVEETTLYVEATPELTFNQQWMFQRQQFAQELIDRLDVDKVVVQETFEGQPMFGGMPGMGGMGDLEDLDLDDVDVDDIADELEAEDLEEELVEE